MKKIQVFGKQLSKAAQKKIFGGVQMVTCSISGGCTCPNGQTYNTTYECISCEDISGGGGYVCHRGDWQQTITCETERDKKCESPA